jgi:hypothetical protein
MRTISKNQLIISRNDEHGAAIISAWKSIGVNTSLHGNGVVVNIMVILMVNLIIIVKDKSNINNMKLLI